MKTKDKQHNPIIDAREMHQQVRDSLGIPHMRAHEQRRESKRSKASHNQKKPSNFNIWGWY